MATKSRTGNCAIAGTVVCFIFIIIAFCTPYWLATDGKLQDPQFIRLGLWEVCFHNFEDFHHHYDYKFTGCWWIYEEEYYIIQDFLWPSFLLLTQFFFTVSTTLVLFGALLTFTYCFSSRDNDKYIKLLVSLGVCQAAAGFTGLIAVIIFGNYGDSRDWMPNWDHNDLGWSFAFACIGSLLLLPTGALYLIEARKANYRRLQASRPSSQYDMDVRKSSHTDI
ncbi:PREDICTED: uncharacterized protein LOC108558489 [Nicrophorus vespilloides]|uniref:Uncharacterized protein LOC108558489 n=1 Tax=Nicrophorus vespilloides TaxID=110193 RepID=A0ABM1M8J5_NICVS|nr:PREDICTED: uncharacterized protein LOC108558489 [Nicrophorus vespilloides]